MTHSYTNFYFVLLAETLPLDFAGPLQVLLEAKRQGVKLDIRYVSASNSLELDGGLQLQALSALPSKLDDNDVLILPGCNNAFHTFDNAQSKQVVKWLKAIVTSQTVLTICSGAILAARAGLLKHKYYTTHYQLIEKMRVAFPECKVLENRIFVDDKNILSSAGISSGIDMALYFVASRFGEKISASIAQEMLVYFRRTGHEPQLSAWLKHRNHMHQAIHIVQDTICENVAENFTNKALAALVFVSERQLSRLFSMHLGLTIGEYTAQIKVARAKELLQKSTHTIEVIAQQCGYSSSRHFRRAWTKYERTTPQVFRQNHREPE